MQPALILVLFGAIYLFVKGSGKDDYYLRRRREHRKLTERIAVTKFVLINAATNKQLIDIEDGDTIKLSTLDLSAEAAELNVEAISSGDVASVGFKFDNGRAKHQKFFADSAFAMCGDRQGDFKTCKNYGVGKHTVTATPYTSRKAAVDTKGKSLSISFTIEAGDESGDIFDNEMDAETDEASADGSEENQGCSIPAFDGEWEPATPYPHSILEGQGAMIGDDFLIVSGFTNGTKGSSLKVQALDTSKRGAAWRSMDDFPISEGVTHAAFVVVGSKFYMCGGYLGGHPGPHMDDCFVYDHSKSPGTEQWKRFSSLPDGRAGGGLIYDSESNSLVFSAGAERPVDGKADAVDYRHTWSLSLKNILGDWVEQSDIPYLTNHMSFVTAKDASGNEHHYFLAGQMGENEHTGNNDEVFEYQVKPDKWVARQKMPFTRGHASSSTRAIGCGFIIAGGSTNEFGKTSDISYFDVTRDSWTTIGKLPKQLNTPVCDIASNRYLYCETGVKRGNFSWRRKIKV